MIRTTIILVLFVATFLITFVAYDVFVEPRVRVRTVRKHFEELSNVRLKYISDLTKQAIQIVSAEIEVDGKGEMILSGLDETSFGRAPYIHLLGIGSYRFRTRSLENGSEGYGWTINIGTSSPIPAVKRLGITNVQSAIAHYDDLVTLIADWPVTPTDWPNGWPRKRGEWANTSTEEIHFPDPPRGDFYFCLTRSNGNYGPLPPKYQFGPRTP